jgi:hypothetical protein
MSFMRALKRRSETRKAAKTNNTEKQPNNSMKAKLAAFNAFKKTYKSSKNNQAVTAPPAAAPSKIENLRARLEAAKLKKAMNKTKKAAKKTDDELINSFFRNNPKTRSITKNTFKKALNDRVPGNHTSNNTMKDIFLNWDWYLQDQQGL